jgi:hypothetical protein
LIFQCLTTSFVRQCLEGIHDFRVAGGDVFKLALYTSAATLNAATTAYTASNEIQDPTYTGGGITLTNLGTNSSGTVGFASFGTATWNPAGFVANGGLIYNTTPTNTYTNPSVCVLSFGFDRAPLNNQFVVTFPTNDLNNAIIRFNAQVP